ncbi:unnamed protein product, partial [Ectocarpus sp. 12 AP-2014]
LPPTSVRESLVWRERVEVFPSCFFFLGPRDEEKPSVSRGSAVKQPRRKQSSCVCTQFCCVLLRTKPRSRRTVSEGQASDRPQHNTLTCG